MEELSKYENAILYCERGNLSLLATKEISKYSKGHIMSVGGGYNAYQQYWKHGNTHWR